MTEARALILFELNDVAGPAHRCRAAGTVRGQRPFAIESAPAASFQAGAVLPGPAPRIATQWPK